MSVFTGRATLINTGNQTLSLGNFQPTWCIIQAVTAEAQSSGNTDGTRQNCVWKFDDNALRSSGNTNTQIVNIQKKVSGVLQDRVVASFVSFGMSGSTGNITLNVAAYEIGVQINVTCGD